MSRVCLSMQLLAVALSLSACSGNSSTGGATNDAEVPGDTPGVPGGSTDSPIDDPPVVVIGPIATNSDNAVFAGRPYKEARAELGIGIINAMFEWR